ncbi:MAG TPA: MBL fold metallo-hydrolase [Solirubrobacteraceae bacterium]|nr:MBL fold metallo-hydrolase [Solirubrobacteraceae bacterium]
MVAVEPLVTRLPTPFAPWHVNGYLFAERPVTIFDPGPLVPSTLPVWERTLDDAGLVFADVEQIVLSHQHWDHLGAAELLREATGASVLAPAAVEPYARHFVRAMDIEVAFYAELMRAHGVPGEHAAKALEVFAALPAYVGSTGLDRALLEGERFRAGENELTVLARPGHSPTDTVFVDHDGRTALVGDHVLGAYPSVIMPPVAAPPVTHEALLCAGAATMIASLRDTAALGLTLALPGHGEAIEDVAGTVARALDYYRRHDRKVLELLDSGPARAWDLVLARDAGVRGEDALYKLASTLGSLELLIADGLVVAERTPAGPRFLRSDRR